MNTVTPENHIIFEKPGMKITPLTRACLEETGEGGVDGPDPLFILQGEEISSSGQLAGPLLQHLQSSLHPPAMSHIQHSYS